MTSSEGGHPAPHAFSRSPVQEVFCGCSWSGGEGSVALTIPAPYPGWPPVREKIRDMIAGAGDISLISGCVLRYTDLIPVDQGKNLPGISAIGHLIAGRYGCSFDSSGNETVYFGPILPGTSGTVSSLPYGRTGWTLIFTMQTDGQARFVSEDRVLNWFDDARDVIHRLFDLIVPEDIVQSLR